MNTLIRMRRYLFKYYKNVSFIEKKEAIHILNLLALVYIYSSGMFLTDALLTRRYLFISLEIIVMTLAMGIALFLWRIRKMDVAIFLTGLYGIGFTMLIFFDNQDMRFYMQLFMVLIVSILGYRKRYQYILSALIIIPIVIIKTTADVANLTQRLLFITSCFSLASLILFYFKKAINLEIETSLALKKNQEFDMLTELPNRRYYENNVKGALEHFKGYILMLDLDHFKTVNDTFGHLIGDEVLKEFAKCIKYHADSKTHIFRWGGEEFLIITENDYYQTLHLAETILKDAGAYKYSVPITLTASIGIAILDQTIQSTEASFSAADKGLYFVKANGRNNYKIWIEKPQKQ